ncbi:hypothetical protein PDTK01_23320 [Phycicoccus sp. DTK01]|nr:hypothetical protein PDTK01_23320 [Phycicoccus sp. DTK01]
MLGVTAEVSWGWARVGRARAGGGSVGGPWWVGSSPDHPGSAVVVGPSVPADPRSHPAHDIGPDRLSPVGADVIRGSGGRI